MNISKHIQRDKEAQEEIERMEHEVTCADCGYSFHDDMMFWDFGVPLCPECLEDRLDNDAGLGETDR